MSNTYTRPQTMGDARKRQAKERREAEIKLAFDNPQRPMYTIPSNGEEEIFVSLLTNFTKGLEHDSYGLVKDRNNYHSEFLKLINANATPAGEQVTYAGSANMAPIYTTPGAGRNKPYKRRDWESPRAGLQYSIQGSDPECVAMPPAPKLGFSELCAELAEVYAMALVRDIPFHQLEDKTTRLKTPNNRVTLEQLRDELGKLSWFKSGEETFGSFKSTTLFGNEAKRRAGRQIDLSEDAAITLFRGSTVGAKTGPYISQFLLIGTPGKAGANYRGKPNECLPKTTEHEADDAGMVFGAQTIDQRVYPAKAERDWMTAWPEYLDVQNGYDLSKLDKFEDTRRTITTPRDLATYVHFDQLYQAYFNACLLMLEAGVPFSSGFPEPAPGTDGNTRGRVAFATFGGPHILSLMTEVASRALKAVRRQKFQIHRRARPEVLAARLTLGHNWHNKRGKLKGIVGDAAEDKLSSMVREFKRDLPNLMQWIDAHNKQQNANSPFCTAESAGTERCPESRADLPKYKPDVDITSAGGQHSLNLLLPMAFPEGSPMHPAYGAGHATVAGACVTILKAFFEMFEQGGAENPCQAAPITYSNAMAKLNPDKDGKPTPMPLYESRLCADGVKAKLHKRDPDNKDPDNKDTNNNVTLQGELDKLAANISIGRNFAGVHYYSDYYDSLRMGERIAVSMLQEQMLNYDEPVSMCFDSFDSSCKPGDGNREVITIATNGDGSTATISINGQSDDDTVADWWGRHIKDHHPQDSAS